MLTAFAPFSTSFGLPRSANYQIGKTGCELPLQAKKWDDGKTHQKRPAQHRFNRQRAHFVQKRNSSVRKRGLERGTQQISNLWILNHASPLRRHLRKLSKKVGLLEGRQNNVVLSVTPQKCGAYFAHFWKLF